MPGTTRYSATFDRTYEEEDEDRPAEAPVSRRSRSQSWQCQTSTESRRYRPLDGLRQARSPSADKDAAGAKGAEVIPTRNVGKATVKAHNNPFQFVKVATAPLHQKTDDQLKKLKEVKKPPVVQEDEEEWQLNLDSWKNRRRKMSETAIRRQEEIRQLVEESQSPTSSAQQKKIKTFSEMVEQRAHRGRALSLCLFSNPLESNDWVFEASKARSNRLRSHDPLSGESAESSTMNSEDDNESYTKHEDDDAKNGYHCVNNNSKSQLTNGHHNGIENSASNSSISKSSELSEFEASQTKDRSSSTGYIDSGLESLSSSHRTGDIPDSGSDFSHDSGSSLDCDSPRVSALITTGIELLEEYSSKDENLFITNTNCQKQVSAKEPVLSPSNNVVQPVAPSSTKDSSEANKVKPKKVIKKDTGINKKLSAKSSQCNGEGSAKISKTSTTSKSVESENEMFVDDFEELARLKSTKGTTEKMNGECKVNGIPFVDPTKPPLNVIFKSDAGKTATAAPSQNIKPKNNSAPRPNSKSFSLITEVPVEKITEEMERLILEQLEEEEKAKEIASTDEKKTLTDGKIDLEAPLKRTEPPKEKPPPPPSSAPPSAPTKEGPLKRVNSTKRIIKEISKRRSDFLGIDKTAEDTTQNETSVPPPPVLEDFLRAEREQDRLRRKMLASKIPSQPYHEDDEIAKKEQEIIENLETEERLRQIQEVPTAAPEIQNVEEERINKLKEERKQIEEERLVAEEQKARLEEARLLQRREEYIRKQEVDDKKDSISSSLSPPIDAPSTNPVSSTGEGGGSLLSRTGDGLNNKAIASSPDDSITKELPPATLPKPPLKKKEAIRKERERLRQEQEALQREREEHRLKIQKEQEQSKKNAQNSHVPPRVDPPIPAKPTQQPRLTNSSLISPVQPQEGSYTGPNVMSRDGNGNQTAAAPTPTTRPSRNAVARTKARVQQKVPCVRKQAEPSSDGRYNQNHWLIQEAEMRRIAEQKERQRSTAPVDARFIAANQVTYHQPPVYSEEYRQTVPQRPSNLSIAQTPNVNSSNYAVPAQLYSPDQHWTFPAQSGAPPRNNNPSAKGAEMGTYPRPSDHTMPGPTKPAKGMPLEKQEQMLSVSGRKRCSHCGEELGRGAAMIIESLQLYYHIQCFQCCVCQAQLGNGSCGTDVRVRNNKLHCHNCYSNDEAGLKFSQV